MKDYSFLIASTSFLTCFFCSGIRLYIIKDQEPFL